MKKHTSQQDCYINNVCDFQWSNQTFKKRNLRNKTKNKHSEKEICHFHKTDCKVSGLLCSNRNSLNYKSDNNAYKQF